MTRSKKEQKEQQAREHGAHSMAAQAQTPGREKMLTAVTQLERFAHSSKKQTQAAISPAPNSNVGESKRLESVQSIKHCSPDMQEQDMCVLNICNREAVDQERDTAISGNGSTRLEQEPTLCDIFTAISMCNANLSTLNGHMSAMKADMAIVLQDMHKINNRLQAAEDRISSLEDSLPAFSKDLKKASLDISTLLAKVNDLENHSRRNNICLVGVPERAEGRDPVVFFESWLLNIFGKEKLSPFFAIERAHRVPTRPLPPGAPPRSILIKLLHFRDCDAMLRLARDQKDLKVDGQKVSIYPDFSSEVQKRRAQFMDIKRRLRNLSVPYSMMYPAKLRVVALGTTHHFDSPGAALQWLDSNEKIIRLSDLAD